MVGTVSDVDEVLAEQLDYYRVRAPEYDDWWERRGRYDRGPAHQLSWEQDIEAAEEKLRQFAPPGRVVEFAAGTGNWTRRLAAMADHVTAIDGAGETLDINRDKLGDPENVTYVCGDVFAFEPQEKYDVVFFSLWLSHVHVDRLADFWDLVRRCLAPDGRVFILDNAHPETSMRVADSQLKVRDVHVTTAQGEIDLSTNVEVRTLANGEYFMIGAEVRPHQSDGSDSEILGRRS
ncbi:MAG: SAM-dependent methyltransferase [Candidatus Poriferisodalaceae bacterium]|jgi:SAM-dependent methyltransferase